MELDIKDVVEAKKMGSPGSIYILLPAALCSELKISEGTEFLLCLDKQKNIVLKRKKEA
ncbi:hypothetical protein KEJ15_09740 [Candidatus Bathyarchaeota archaeon]|jgi:antitoxin component of MazEF toxin-antitoxin module|nr:hypothetical protein [Candidatus Bathyarchaeota archaeon]